MRDEDSGINHFACGDAILSTRTLTAIDLKKIIFLKGKIFFLLKVIIAI
jgi:hypothetical protein